MGQCPHHPFLLHLFFHSLPSSSLNSEAKRREGQRWMQPPPLPPTCCLRQVPQLAASDYGNRWGEVLDPKSRLSSRSLICRALRKEFRLCLELALFGDVAKAFTFICEMGSLHGLCCIQHCMEQAGGLLRVRG